MKKTQRAVLLAICTLWLGIDAGLGASLPTPPYPVIFIHGLASSADTWNDLREFLTDHGWTNGGSPRYVKGTWPTNDYVTGASRGTFYTMNMSDYAGSPPGQMLSFWQQGHEVGKVVERVRLVNGQARVILVGHSMGGLAARAYLEGRGDWDPTRRLSYNNDVAKLVTCGTPHQGTPLTTIIRESPYAAVVPWLFNRVNPDSVAVTEMAQDSPELALLNSTLLPSDVQYTSLAVYSKPAMLYWAYSSTALSDGIVSFESQNLAATFAATGCAHTMQTVEVFSWNPLAWAQVHTDEPSDLSVWDSLVRQILGPETVPNTLRLNVVANPDPVRPGEQLVITMTVANQGMSDLSGVELRMVTPSHVSWYENADAVPLPDGAGYAGVSPGEGEAWTLGTLAAGQSRTVVVSAGVDSGSAAPTDGTLIPVTAMVVAGNGASAASSASVVVDNSPMLRVTLDEDRDPVGPGETLSYTLTYANPANVSAPNTVLRALVPLNTTFQSATDGGVLSGGWAEWSLGTVGAGQSGQRHFTVQVAGGLASGTEVLGQAEVFDGATPQDTARAEVVTVVSAGTPLSLALVASPNPARPGEQVELVMTVANRGGTDLAGVKLWQMTPSHVSWYENADAVPLPDGAGYAGVSPGEGEAWTLGTLAAGQSRTVVVSAGVDSGSAAPTDGTLIPVTAMVVAGNGASAASSASVVVGQPVPVVWPLASVGNGHFYQVVPVSGKISWHQANAAAQALGGYLATITSAAENDFVFNLIDRSSLWTASGNSRLGPWLGGVQAIGSPEPAGGWGWVTGEVLAYSNWYTGEPNNGSGNQDRLYFLTQSPLERAATWGDKNGTDTLAGYVVEFGPAVIQRPSLGSAQMRSDGTVDFKLAGEAGVQYRVQASTNLVDWIEIGTVTPIGGNAASFRDTECGNLDRRFYRLVCP